MKNGNKKKFLVQYYQNILFSNFQIPLHLKMTGRSTGWGMWQRLQVPSSHMTPRVKVLRRSYLRAPVFSFFRPRCGHWRRRSKCCFFPPLSTIHWIDYHFFHPPKGFPTSEIRAKLNKQIRWWSFFSIWCGWFSPWEKETVYFVQRFPLPKHMVMGWLLVSSGLWAPWESLTTFQPADGE